MKNVLLTIILVFPLLVNARRDKDTSGVSYNQKVFPADVNMYPLVFITNPTDTDHEIKKKYIKECHEQLNKFIESEKKNRGIEHVHLTSHNLSGYDKSTYKYLVTTRVMFYHGTTMHTNGTTHSYSMAKISYCFTNRQSQKFYSPFGHSVVDPCPTYNPGDIEGTSSKQFFKALQRIIANLDTSTPAETFEKETELQIKGHRNSQIIFGSLVASAVVGCGIVGLLSSI